MKCFFFEGLVWLVDEVVTRRPDRLLTLEAHPLDGQEWLT